MSEIVTKSLERTTRQSQLLAATAVGIALLALTGWLSGVRSLAGQLDSYIPMAPSTALAFLLLGGALFGFARWPGRSWGRFFALAALSLVSLLGLLVLAQFFTGIDLGVEQALSQTNEWMGSTPVGRMSPLTAVSFLLESAALFMLLPSKRRRNASTAAALLAAGATALNVVVLTGYFYGAPLLYGGAIIPVAFTTAIAFILVGVGLIISAVPGVRALRAWSRNTTRGFLLRAFLPFTLFFILIEGWLSAWLQAILPPNPALRQSLTALTAGVLVVVIIGWIARHTGSEIERAQETLAESEERYRILAEASHDFIVLVNRRWEVEYTNAFAARQFGSLPQELVGKQLADVFPREVAERQQSNLQKVFESGEALHIEAPVVFSANPIWLSSSLVPIKDKDGEAKSVLIVSRDITERKRAEQEIRQRAEELATLNAFGRRVTSSLSVNEVAQTALEEIVHTVSPDLAMFFVRAGGRLILRRSQTRTGDLHHIETPVHRVGECLCGLAVEQAQPVY
ncbi:MAG: PAS domain-containing protein, partial [Chloroflexi bacterium]|nr:PAS domain-containing protein [Chloroflexota bacterium]